MPSKLPFKFVSKRYKLFMYFELLIVTAVIAAIVILLANYFIYSKNHTKQIAHDKNINSKRIISEIDGSILYIENITNFLAKKIHYGNSNNKYFIASILRDITPSIDDKRYDIFTWTLFDFVDPNGHVIAASTLGVIENPSLVTSDMRSWINNAKSEPWQLHFSQRDIGVISKEQIIPVGFGVTGKNDRFLGVISLGVNVEKLILKLENAINNSTANFVLFDEKMSVINYSKSFDKSDIDKIENYVLKNHKNFKNNEFIKINNKVYYYKTSKHYPFSILSGMNEKELKREFWNEFTPRILNYIYLILFFLAILYFLKFLLLKPIVELSQATKQIALKNFDTTIPQSSIFEISLLAESIKSLRSFLKKEEIVKQQIKDAEASARLANEAKQRLIKAISHDARNYISRINNLSEIITEEVNDIQKAKSSEVINKDVKQHLNLIQSQSKELLLFIEDLLNDKHLTSGSLQVGQKIDCNIKEFLQGILILNKEFFLQQKVSVELKVEKNLPLLPCDERRLRQIITNILSNAAKYSNENGVIKIIAKYLEKPSQIVIEIIDNGIGMTEEQVKMMLQGDGYNIKKTGLNKAIDSHGIGMKTVMQLVESHGAKMDVESQKFVGTTIRLLFPILDVEEIEEKQIRILIVDDQEVNLLTTRLLLEKEIPNLVCDIAKSASEAFILIGKEIQYDLILTDIQMPKTDGFAMAKRIREINNKTPIIAYSSTISDSMIERNHDEIDQFLTKPISDKLLIKTVQKWNLLPQKSVLSKHDLEVIQGKKVLLADDEELNLILMTKILKKYGFTVTTVKNGKELYETYIKNDDFDVIISDIKMPIIDGCNAARQIRDYEIKEKLYYKTPIIAYSGDKNKEIVHRTLRSGICDYYVKGDDNKILIKMIAFWVGFCGNNEHKSKLKSKRKAEILEIENRIRIAADKNQNFSVELIEIFNRDAQRLISEITEANNVKDLDRFNFSSHALKGICGVAKMHDLFKHVNYINNLAKENKWATKSDLKKLQDIFEKTKDNLLKNHKKGN